MNNTQKTVREMKKETKNNPDLIYYNDDGKVIYGGHVYSSKEHLIKTHQLANKWLLRTAKVFNFFSFKKRINDAK